MQSRHLLFSLLFLSGGRGGEGPQEEDVVLEQGAFLVIG